MVRYWTITSFVVGIGFYWLYVGNLLAVASVAFAYVLGVELCRKELTWYQRHSPCDWDRWER